MPNTSDKKIVSVAVDRSIIYRSLPAAYGVFVTYDNNVKKYATLSALDIMDNYGAFLSAEDKAYFGPAAEEIRQDSTLHYQKEASLRQTEATRVFQDARVRKYGLFSTNASSSTPEQDGKPSKRFGCC